MFEDISKVVLISDMDGTLLDSHKNITDIDRDAIERFMALDGKFTVATGRTLQSFVQYRSMLPLHMPVIMYNGAAIYDFDKNEYCFTKPLPDSARQITADFLEALPEIGGEVLKADGTYIFRNNDYQQLHTKLCNIEPYYAKLDEITDGGWLKVLFSMAPEVIPHAEIFAAQKNYKNVDFVRSSDIFYEMLPDGITKGSALDEYRKLPGMEGFTFVAVGDFDNDLDMIKRADLGACPSNAQEIVRESSDLVLSRTNDEGAIAELIDYIIRKCGENK